MGHSPHDPPLMGWALPKPAQKSRFTPEQIKFLRDLYWEGEKTKRKATPDGAAKKMRVTFSSNPELWLKPAQILSYFSRYTSEVRKKGITEFKPDEEQAREEASTTIAEEPPENNIYQEPYEDQEQVSYLTTEEQIRTSVAEEEDLSG